MPITGLWAGGGMMALWHYTEDRGDSAYCGAQPGLNPNDPAAYIRLSAREKDVTCRSCIGLLRGRFLEAVR